jgi:hypothetical protein
VHCVFFLCVLVALVAAGLHCRCFAHRLKVPSMAVSETRYRQSKFSFVIYCTTYRVTYR